MQGGASSLIFLVLLVGIFYFMLIRPQKRRVDQHRTLIESLGLGDEIVTIGGIFGTIRNIHDEDMEIEIASGTVIRIVKSAVARQVVDESDDVDDVEEQEEPPADDRA
ncbi:MAG: preprotein translocase subunit YajC [Actinomycetota bacterium]|nr:preprotein translocase subunit YajC [Actinomycetota bacterium]